MRGLEFSAFVKRAPANQLAVPSRTNMGESVPPHLPSHESGRLLDFHSKLLQKKGLVDREGLFLTEDILCDAQNLSHHYSHQEMENDVNKGLTEVAERVGLKPS